MMQINRELAPDHGLLFPFEAPDPDIAAHLMAEALPNMPMVYELQLGRPALHRAMLAAGAQPEEHVIEFAGSL